MAAACVPVAFVCVCVRVKVVRHLLQSDEEMDLQMPWCCQSWPGEIWSDSV